VDGGTPAGAEEERLRRVYDAYTARHYDAKWSERLAGNANMAREVEDRLSLVIPRHPATTGTGLNILDLGCGEGGSLRALQRIRPETALAAGCDVLEGSLRGARQLVPDGSFACANGMMLPFRTASFDLVTLFTVLSSVTDERIAGSIASEARRVLRPGGAIIVYDLRFPSPRNRFVQRVSRPRLRAAFPGALLRVTSLTLLPPIARAIGDRPGMYRWLAAVPLLRSHFLALVTTDGS
jgi:ubiquinone/menaquinone biosynthesis C-methylase UbiE